MTLYQSLTNTTTTSVWYLVNPPVGTGTVSITLTAANRVVAHATNLYNVNQTTPLTGVQTSTSNTPSLAISSGSGDLVMDLMGHNSNNGITVGAGQTQIFDQSSALVFARKLAQNPRCSKCHNVFNCIWSSAYIAYNVEAVASAGVVCKVLLSMSLLAVHKQLVLAMTLQRF